MAAAGTFISARTVRMVDTSRTTQSISAAAAGSPSPSGSAARTPSISRPRSASPAMDAHSASVR